MASLGVSFICDLFLACNTLKNWSYNTNFIYDISITGSTAAGFSVIFNTLHNFNDPENSLDLLCLAFSIEMNEGEKANVFFYFDRHKKGQP